MKVFVDSSTIIFGLSKEESNSSLLLKLIEERAVQAVISEQVFEEVTKYFAQKRGERGSYFLKNFLKSNFEIILRSRITKTAAKLRGKIKDKDLEHLATARVAGAKIVALDRHFKPFKEYLTPKQLVQKLGLKAFETDY